MCNHCLWVGLMVLFLGAMFFTCNQSSPQVEQQQAAPKKAVRTVNRKILGSWVCVREQRDREYYIHDDLIENESRTEAIGTGYRMIVISDSSITSYTRYDDDEPCYEEFVMQYTLDGITLIGPDFGYNEPVESGGYTRMFTTLEFRDGLLKMDFSEESAGDSIVEREHEIYYFDRYSGKVPPATWPDTRCVFPL